MAGTSTFFVALFLCVAISSKELVAQNDTDFFSVSANHITDMIRQQLANTFGGEGFNNRMKRAEEEVEENENSGRPELHFSTLRAQASGSGFPSPTMFIGGFSFMMMPTPEGEQIFNRIMETIPNLANRPGGGK